QVMHAFPAGRYGAAPAPRPRSAPPVPTGPLLLSEPTKCRWLPGSAHGLPACPRPGPAHGVPRSAPLRPRVPGAWQRWWHLVWTVTSQGAERRPGPLSALDYTPLTYGRRQRFRSASTSDAGCRPAGPEWPRSAPDGRRRGRSDARGLHAAQLVLELFDLVPDPGRYLELELRGGYVHLVGELGYQRDQVTAGRPATGFLARGTGRGPDP